MCAMARTHPADRMWSRVEIGHPRECWPWTGATRRYGYGNLRMPDGNVSAHRVAYADFYGEVPEGRILLHTCDTPPCCNPFHLVPGTQRDNLHDMTVKGRRVTVFPAGRDALGRFKGGM